MAKLNTAVIYGSARKDRQGIKAARFIVRQLEDRGHNVTLVDSQVLRSTLPTTSGSSSSWTSSSGMPEQ
jgi:menaquinone-dependent protoporphyrinogen IX oxidase